MKRMIIWSACVAVALNASAALVSYDVGDYVQDGLVSQFDGIRNVGAGLPHDAAAVSWANLVKGAPDFVFVNESRFKTADGWKTDGFVFVTNIWAKMNGGINVTTNFSVQFVCDIGTAASHHADAKRFPNYLTVVDSIDVCSFYTRPLDAGNNRLEVRNDWLASTKTDASGRCVLPSWDGFGFTMIMDEVCTRMFTGDSPDGGDCRERDRWRTADNMVWAIGRCEVDTGFRGTVNAVRFYNRALTDAEVALNNRIDRFRFRGERSVTNVVVCSGRPGLVCAESGNCQVSGEHVFSAPSVCTNVDGTAVYVCSGYSLETWNAAESAWGDPVAVADATEYAYEVGTSPEKVRLTWQWRQISGLVLAEPCDYVQDGLVAQYDAIRNQGADAPHSDYPAWCNLKDASNPLYLSSVGDDTGSWGLRDYRFRGNTFAAMARAISLNGDFTVEAAVDSSESRQTSKYHFLFGPECDDAFSLFENNNNWQMKLPCRSNERPYLHKTAWNGNYLAVAGDDTLLSLTDGTTWDHSVAVKSSPTSIGSLRLIVSGGGGGKVADYPSESAFVGDLHSFRIYDRKLSEDELAYNREIDERRFHDVLPVTNIVVSSLSPAADARRGTGIYQVMDRHVFRAPCERAAKGDRVYLLEGYRIDRWDAATGDWIEVARRDGNSFEFVVADWEDKIRLTWLWRRGGGLVRYDVDDYVQDDLVHNFDALRNAGADRPHDDAIASWKDSADSDVTISFTQFAESARTGWGEDRYRCAGAVYGTFSAPVLLPESSTIQIVLSDTDFGSVSKYPTFFSRPDDVIAFYTRSNNHTLEWKHHGSQTPRKMLDGWEGRYFDAVMTATSFYLSQDAARGEPLSKNYAAYFRNNSHDFGIGAEANDAASTYANCSYHAVRIYNHALQEWELRHNRMVDEVRYRGALPVTNVIVASSEPFLEGVESNGAYQVGESHVFTARRQRIGSNTYRPVGYLLERWDASENVWTEPSFVRASAYAHKVDSSSEKVRITWVWECGLLLLVR